MQLHSENVFLLLIKFIKVFNMSIQSVISLEEAREVARPDAETVTYANFAQSILAESTRNTPEYLLKEQSLAYNEILDRLQARAESANGTKILGVVALVFGAVFLVGGIGGKLAVADVIGGICLFGGLLNINYSRYLKEMQALISQDETQGCSKLRELYKQAEIDIKKRADEAATTS